MQKCKGFLFLRHISKVERIDIQQLDPQKPFLAGPPVLDSLSKENKKKFFRDQVCGSTARLKIRLAPSSL